MSPDALTLQGLWQRLILSVPGEPVDTLTMVEWLQGPTLYVDLRQPVGLAGKVKATCLAELTSEEAALLATQEGFAGRLVLAGDSAEWLRQIDFQPSLFADRGRLEVHGDLLIEHGLETPYVEHWQRRTTGPAPVAGSAAFLSESDGCEAVLVRHGNRFGYARGRTLQPFDGRPLGECVASTSADEAGTLVDCEISLGTIVDSRWTITRSSLPWRVGAVLLAPGASLEGARLTVHDLDRQGAPMLRRLRLLQLHGSLLPADEPQPAPAPRAAPPVAAIPVVDIAALGSGDAAAEAVVVEALGRAAGESGFLHVTGHGIAPAVAGRLQAAARAFFAQSEAAKLASYIGQSTNHRGYVPEGEETLGEGKRDRKEAFDLALDLPATDHPGHPLLGPNQWPDLPGFREDVMAWYGAVFAVGQRLLRGFALALGQPEDCFAPLLTTPPSQLRLIHYPHDAAAVDAPGIGAHTDYECFTLLLATGPGLEVMNAAGEWVDAPPVPGALVVNIGDMLEYWSGGRFVATSHRVRKVAEERWSFPLFFALDYDVHLRPLGQPEAEPIRTGEHLYAQTVQTFRYLKDRAARGEIALPSEARPLSSFGQEARHRQTVSNPA